MNRIVSLCVLGLFFYVAISTASVTTPGVSDLNTWDRSQHDLVARKSYPWCEGVYEPTAANCKKYDFGNSSSTNCIEPHNCTT